MFLPFIWAIVKYNSLTVFVSYCLTVTTSSFYFNIENGNDQFNSSPNKHHTGRENNIKNIFRRLPFQAIPDINSANLLHKLSLSRTLTYFHNFFWNSAKFDSWRILYELFIHFWFEGRTDDFFLLVHVFRCQLVISKL